MEDKKIKNCFKNGPINAAFIGESIAKHQSKKTIGAHQIFLGQVRDDLIGNKNVQAIDYSAHLEMANNEFNKIRETAFEKFELVCLHIYHSIGIVKSGEICLFVFVSSKHRKAAQKAVEFIVEEIKTIIPVFGREILEDESHVWKINK
jgi:molybdopterin synthase catalytic subunit